MIKADKDYACVIENKLYFGNATLARNDTEWSNWNINTIVDLIKYPTQQDEIKHSSEFTWYHLSIEDSPTNNIDWVEQVSEFVDKEIKNGKIVYVHCSQGISRSSAVLLHYLWTRCNKRLKNSFEQWRSLRHVVSPIYGFMKGLSEWETKIYGSTTFSPEEYSWMILQEDFRTVNVDEIKDIYEKTKNKILSNLEEYEKMSIEKQIEPVGYFTFEELLKKYGKEACVERFGCSLHHPFD